ncbi:hypothetical protein SAY86_020479 [Trapa natans]|uniref:Clp R domain-containing protein n=1 Tax=Trapa natans TaxID=22666 RepID=A0AAN7M2F8_TRANT|nr:hypothetical protein SAY86_020479 [Trapa natans]
MPTPVSVARQCLTEEAASALDDAVSVARRRSHAQTNSLHAVSALLSLPSSPLREACGRAWSVAYSPRLQFKALELSVGVSLDRLPCVKNVEEPPISNSLMAAIKRSQANQKRSPESFHLQQIHSSQQATSLTIKVELKHFLLSILDDPIVSRVFGEAGFRSYDIKLAIVQPAVPPASRLFRSSCPPPIFLCNLMDGGSHFPGSGEDSNENFRRIGEVLGRKSGKNPIIIGMCSKSALESFLDGVESGKQGVLSAGLDRLSTISIENDIGEGVKMSEKFNELSHELRHSSNSGVIVSLGPLTSLIHEDGDAPQQEAARYVVSELTALLKAHKERLWVIGAAESYETFQKFLSQFPDAEKDWDLHLLPITYRSSSSSAQIFSTSKSSLMGSFVPFGGFFSMPTEYATPSSSPFSGSQCDLCNKKCAEEVAALMQDGSSTSVSDRCSTNLPSWLQMSESDSHKPMDVSKKDDRTTLNAKILELQNKWNKVCHSLHNHQPVFNLAIQQARPEVVATDSFNVAADPRKWCSDGSPISGNKCPQVAASIATDLHRISHQEKDRGAHMASQAEQAHMQNISETNQITRIGGLLPSQKLPTYNLLPTHQALPPSITNVGTNLGLGLTTVQSESVPEKTWDGVPVKWRVHGHQGCTQQPLGSPSSSASVLGARLKPPLGDAQQSSPSGYNNFEMYPDPQDFKAIWGSLKGNVGWQDEALCIISQVVSCYKSGSLRRLRFGKDLWMTFLGPDVAGKRRTALALAEIFHDTKRLIYADLSSQKGIRPTCTTCEFHELQACEMLRGKTVVDYIADELRQKPNSVVYLENIDRADPLIQNCLSQALKTGKLKDTYGREFSTRNTIFVATSTVSMDGEVFPSNTESDYSEERVLKSRRWQMQISVESVAAEGRSSKGMAVVVTSQKSSATKRKHSDMDNSSELDRGTGTQRRSDKLSLDLNLPVTDVEEELDDVNTETETSIEDSDSWFKDFLGQVDRNVVFKPYDFKGAAQTFLEEMRITLQSAVGFEVPLEIDDEVMMQIVAAGWQCKEQEAIKWWIRQVMRRGFLEAHQRYKLTADSAVKLASCKGIALEQQAPGVCLPASINLK